MSRLSDDAVEGTSPVTMPVCPPFVYREPALWQSEAYERYTTLIQPYIDAQIRAVRRREDRHEKQVAFLLFGVHL